LAVYIREPKRGRAAHSLGWVREQAGRLHEVCCVVVDELHTVGEAGRGANWEMPLAKLLYATSAQCPASRRHPGVQLVAMSATVGAVGTLARWLRAELFLTNFRPVPLVQYALTRTAK